MFISYCAVNGEDFRISPLKLTFTDPDTPVCITVDLLEDNRIEGTQTFNLNLEARNLFISVNGSTLIVIRDSNGITYMYLITSQGFHLFRDLLETRLINETRLLFECNKVLLITILKRTQAYKQGRLL